MYYCKKCQKEFEDENELYYGFCFECYKEQLLYLVAHPDDEEFRKQFKEENKFVEFIKKLFKK